MKEHALEADSGSTKNGQRVTKPPLGHFTCTLQPPKTTTGRNATQQKQPICTFSNRGFSLLQLTEVELLRRFSADMLSEMKPTDGDRKRADCGCVRAKQGPLGTAGEDADSGALSEFK